MRKGARNWPSWALRPTVVNGDGVLITDGNAASNATRFFRASEGLKVIQDNWRVIQAEYWNDQNGSKRKIMAECLVPERIAPEHIHTIFVADQETKQKGRES